MIYNCDPTDWKNLQDLVASIFREIGCETFTEKEIDTVRGKVEVDVYAKDNKSTPESLYICECKFWNKPVPKNVVHSFRTVIADSGANHGYIISKKGFQSGAYDAAINSNITLRSWSEFQEEFFNIWNQASIDKLSSKLREICRYADVEEYPDCNVSEYIDNTKKGLRFSLALWEYMEKGGNVIFPYEIKNIMNFPSNARVSFESRYELIEYTMQAANEIIGKYMSLSSNSVN